ncbi:unnamed protein product [Haemonchus placei]|uniref:Nuclear receptor domain-containing protein n=1 Tax=Haemonchus placei TaxID=6290 RepID=A0A0N4W4P5_HAEPC|nr:unnamed protein product [Haemonchus placei]
MLFFPIQYLNFQTNWLLSSTSSSTPYRTTLRQCTICSAPSNGYHFNAPSCSACAAFFRRTVTLGRHFLCAHQGNCKVHFEMRVICRACRYAKCIQMGMERQAVQPRRDSNNGRRKISYSKRASPSKQWASVTTTPKRVQGCLIAISRETGEGVLEMLLREERLYNERRSILYCVKSSISEILSAGEVNDIPFSSRDLTELTFAGVRKDIRAQILATYEWMRGWNHFKCLSTSDKKILLRRCTLFHPIIDPCYLTMRLGLPDRFVMFNGMFTGIAVDSEEGWRDESCISATLKKELYRPLLDRVLADIVRPMQAINISFVEYVILKALVTFKSTLSTNISSSLKRCLNSQIDLIFVALSNHYANLGMSAEDVAVRTGNVILLVGNIFEVGMQCLESHQVIQFFDLWKLDDLLIKLISESLQSSPKNSG